MSSGICEQCRLRSACTSAVWTGPSLCANKIIEYYRIYGEQRPGWYFAHAQDDLNLHILHMFKGTFLLGLDNIMYLSCLLKYKDGKQTYQIHPINFAWQTGTAYCGPPIFMASEMIMVSSKLASEIITVYVLKFQTFYSKLFLPKFCFLFCNYLSKYTVERWTV